MKLRYIALAAALMLSGCGGAENSSGGNESASQVVTTTSSAAGSAESEAVTSEPQGSSLKELSEELKAADSSILTGSALYGERLFEKNCQKLYLCRQSDLTDGFIVYNNGGGKADEISVIKRADGDSDRASKVLNDRKTVRYNDFKGYVPAELPKIEAGRVFTVKGYSVLIISDSADRLEKIIREKLS
ncbi:protein of unknown function [Ruminococcaceae bacterium FB2012]|nr:protein of unknown function [Ruminococcaceae bacterium FB2012]